MVHKTFGIYGRVPGITDAIRGKGLLLNQGKSKHQLDALASTDHSEN